MKESAELVNDASDLDSLLEGLNRLQDTESELDIKWTDHYGIDLSFLPTYGGEEPANTSGVWSWDETRLLVGDGSDWEIVKRCDWNH